MFTLSIDFSAADIREVIGAAASFFVFLSFFETDMTKLRVFSITSNVLFISYAVSRHLPPIWILHSALLPLNTYRLIQLKGRVKESHKIHAAPNH
ncbi:hypothetical protein SOPP22_18825 [Shewanella sp. OPT22]|nr:hypothetical protein SOPP22_18825 [Shewanella sp. OPT22]